jgi:hypothetical protein
VKVTSLVPQFGRFPEAAAIERRDAELVALADATVIVWEDRAPVHPVVVGVGEGEGELQADAKHIARLGRMRCRKSHRHSH